MLAARATLVDVLNDEAYELLGKLGTRLASGCQNVADRYDIPAVTTDMGCKGSITFRDKPIVHYRDFLEVDDSLFEAFWYFLLNRGVYMTPGKEEQWTISVQHSEGDIDLMVDLFDKYCEIVTS
jgi:glutamate-1-semialdehyde 2,1-aminomutase